MQLKVFILVVVVLLATTAGAALAGLTFFGYWTGVASVLSLIIGLWHWLRPKSSRAIDPSVKRLLARLAGDWRLTYTRRGKQYAEDTWIDRNGNLGLTTDRAKPEFRLEVEAFNTATGEFTWSKESLRWRQGWRRKLAETLVLQADGMAASGRSHARKSPNDHLEYCRLTNDTPSFCFGMTQSDGSPLPVHSGP